ncbi:hypothetical protein EDB80DRAFT_138036 [Ilyonectria destructans]|nr:hypothetical protein EDB80DRAFT_138036 [Ilyonectria destructans]
MCRSLCSKLLMLRTSITTCAPQCPFVRSTHLVSLVLLPLKGTKSSRIQPETSASLNHCHSTPLAETAASWASLGYSASPTTQSTSWCYSRPSSFSTGRSWVGGAAEPPPGFLFCPGHRHKCVCICSYEPGPGQPVSRAKWLVGATTRTHTCTYSYVQYLNCRRSALPIFLGRRLDCFIMKPTPVPSPWVVAQTQNKKCLR